MLEHLANIELAHMALLQAALDSQANWALILEDDAIAFDIDDLAAQLDVYGRTWLAGEQPKYVNMSRSFETSQLNLSEPTTLVSGWGDKAEVRSARVPFTNTVCAILYRREFLTDLLPELDRIPLEPIMPIDWKLNAALMQLSSTTRLSAGDCYEVNPAPIVQGSMHNSADQPAAR